MCSRVSSPKKKVTLLVTYDLSSRRMSATPKVLANRRLGSTVDYACKWFYSVTLASIESFCMYLREDGTPKKNAFFTGNVSSHRTHITRFHYKEYVSRCKEKQIEPKAHAPDKLGTTGYVRMPRQDSMISSLSVSGSKKPWMVMWSQSRGLSLSRQLPRLVSRNFSLSCLSMPTL